MITNGSERGGRLSGANSRMIPNCDLDCSSMSPCFLTSSSSSGYIPHAAKSCGSAAPIDVATITSASRRALVAAMLQALENRTRS
jgi:hypothetical protein